MLKRRTCFLASSLCIVFLAASFIEVRAENPPQITVINNAERVRLLHSTHPLVASASDMGRADPTLRLERMLLVLGPTNAIQPSLKTFLDGRHDKKSANYRRWLTPEQFGERFGPSQADLAKIAAWLGQQGFDSIKVSPGRSHIEFSGSAGRGPDSRCRCIRIDKDEMHLANNFEIAAPNAMLGIVCGLNLQTFSFSNRTRSKLWPKDANLAATEGDPDHRHALGIPEIYQRKS